MFYQPRDDSFLLKEQVIKLSKGKRVLDMGTGSGIHAETALNNCAKSVLAADINNECSSILKKKGIKFIQSDLFSDVKGRFDLIIFNPPYLPLDKREDEESSLTTSGGKRGDELILRFLKQSSGHLAREGIILLLLSSLTPQNSIKRLLKKLNMNCKVISEKNIFMEKLEVWKISN